jgi:hypothetical protein
MAKAPPDTDRDHLVPLGAGNRSALTAYYDLLQSVKALEPLPVLQSPTHSIYEDPWVWTDMDEYGIIDPKERDECCGVRARVYALFDRYAWSPEANAACHDLMGQLDRFSMTLRYRGPDDATAKARPRALTSRTAQGDPAPPGALEAVVSPDRAALLVRGLAAAGVLERLRDANAQKIALPAGPTFTLEVKGAKGRWYADLGWGQHVLSQVMGAFDLGPQTQPPPGKQSVLRPQDKFVAQWQPAMPKAKDEPNPTPD